MPLRVLKNALFAMDVENLTSPLTNFLKLGPLLRQSMSISVKNMLTLCYFLKSKKTNFSKDGGTFLKK